MCNTTSESHTVGVPGLIPKVTNDRILGADRAPNEGLTSMKPFSQFDVDMFPSMETCFGLWGSAFAACYMWRVRFHRWKHDSDEVPTLENFLKILYSSVCASFHRWKNEDIYFPSMELCWGKDSTDGNTIWWSFPGGKTSTDGRIF